VRRVPFRVRPWEIDSFLFDFLGVKAGCFAFRYSGHRRQCVNLVIPDST
jgi:hypothetical protein